MFCEQGCLVSRAHMILKGRLTRVVRYRSPVSFHPGRRRCNAALRSGREWGWLPCEPLRTANARQSPLPPTFSRDNCDARLWVSVQCWRHFEEAVQSTCLCNVSFCFCSELYSHTASLEPVVSHNSSERIKELRIIVLPLYVRTALVNQPRRR